jgi:glycosyltransferase involved in cell wall biosynthesis
MIINTYSVMIMSHNQKDMLYECITRLHQFTPFPFELIVVDDASEDIYNIKGATIVRMPKRSNCCNLRNVGMEMATTPWVFWLDNDTMVNEGWSKPLTDMIDKYPLLGLTGQAKDGQTIRNPFLPLTVDETMHEAQFLNTFKDGGKCDFITSYCVLVRRLAYRPTYCYNMPTPALDPELGAVVKMNGFEVRVVDHNINISHIGSQTPRPGGNGYQQFLVENFTKWWEFWSPHASKVFELYK